MEPAHNDVDVHLSSNYCLTGESTNLRLHQDFIKHNPELYSFAPALNLKSESDSDAYDGLGQGHYHDHHNESNTSFRNVYRFLGVPFAQPPVGRFRFKPPQRLIGNGKIDAKSFGPVCPQNLDRLYSRSPYPVKKPSAVSEDCLYLNVWTPSLDQSALLPVMVWIHGGGFISSFSDVYDGLPMTTFKDVVFVSVNYRVGIFGFLCTGDDSVPGNCGLLDQVEALHWVHNHIKSFGGDPDNVTLCGLSAGSISALLLRHYSGARGLFRRVIGQSGTPIIYTRFQTTEEATDTLRNYLRQIGFQGHSGKDMLNFLNSKSTDWIKANLDNFRIAPVLDNKVITAQPFDMLQQQLYSGSDLLIGCTSHEGAYTAVADGQTVDGFKQLAKRLLLALSQSDLERTVADAVTQYLSSSLSQSSIGVRAVEFVGDRLFVAPLLVTALHYSKSCPTYVYHYCHRPAYSTKPRWVKADHADDIFLSLGMAFLGIPQTPVSREDVTLSRRMMDYWANFAKSGNPNGGSLPQWPRYNEITRQHLILSSNVLSACNLLDKHLPFWSQIYPVLLNISSKL